MGCNALIYLPRDVRVRDVATVAGIIAGLEVNREPIGHGNATATRCIGAEVKTTSVPSMVELIFRAAKGKHLIDGEEVHVCHYFFECGNPDNVELYPASTPFWIALGIRLCRFFGGRIVFNDCGKDGHKAQRRFAKPRKSNCPDDGKPWQDFEDEIAMVKPLTKADLKRTKKYGAY